MKDLKLEEVSPLFMDESLLTNPVTIYRLNKSGDRYYYDFDQNGEPRFYISVTTMIQNTLPTSPFLIDWKANLGKEEAERVLRERAAYGTFMHIQFAELLQKREYDIDLLPRKLKEFIQIERLPENLCSEWEEDLKKDILAFSQFIIDHNVKPLAIEIMLTHQEDCYAGAIDLVCELTIEESGFWGETTQKGDPKKTKKRQIIRAIIDFKSGRKGFYESHEIQLAAYREMWNNHFPDYPVEKIYNWSPKEWTGSKPTYNFKDQTGSKNIIKLPLLVNLMSIEQEKMKMTVNTFWGKIDLENGLENNIKTIPLTLAVKQELERKIQEAKEKAEFDEVFENKD